MASGSSEGARERPVPLRTVACDACWDDAVHFPDREPVRPDVELVVEQLKAAAVHDPVQGSLPPARTAVPRAPGTAPCMDAGS
jgi:hypothetical protein